MADQTYLVSRKGSRKTRAIKLKKTNVLCVSFSLTRLFAVHTPIDHCLGCYISLRPRQPLLLSPPFSVFVTQSVPFVLAGVRDERWERLSRPP